MKHFQLLCLQAWADMPATHKMPRPLHPKAASSPVPQAVRKPRSSAKALRVSSSCEKRLLCLPVPRAKVNDERSSHLNSAGGITAMARAEAQHLRVPPVLEPPCGAPQPMVLATACTGTVKSDNQRFGFIQQDNGGEDQFMLPPIPSLGTRVT